MPGSIFDKVMVQSYTYVKVAETGETSVNIYVFAHFSKLNESNRYNYPSHV